MNFINRTLIVLQLLIAIVSMPILAALVLLRPGLFDTLGIFARTNNGSSGLTSQLICAGLAVIVFLIAILLVALELHRPAIRRLKVQDVSGGDVEITKEAIVHRLESSLGEIGEVTRVHPRVMATKKGNVVDLFLDVETNPDVNVPQITQEVLTGARQTMEDKMGLKVGKIQVRIDHAKKSKQQKEKSNGGSQTPTPPTEFPTPPNQPKVSG